MENKQETGLETLVVWQKAVDLAVWVYRTIVPVLPREEKFNLGDQLRRAVQSIPANIAEGHGRFYYQESVRFSYLARGSLEETRSHLILAYKLGFLPEDCYKQADQKTMELRRILNGYINYLKQSKRGSSEPGSAIIMREEAEVYTTEMDGNLEDPPENLASSNITAQTPDN